MSPEKRAAAGIIRRAVWRGVMPPSPDRRPWSMARELHTWQRLVDAGTDPRELNAALLVLRTVRPSAVRLTHLARGADGAALLADVLQAARVTRAVSERPHDPHGAPGALRGVGDVLLSLGLAARRPKSWLYQDYCGPAAVASALGISRERAARLLVEAHPPIGGASTSVYAVESVLGTRAYPWPLRPLPTLARFVRLTPRAAVVFAGSRELSHWLHVAPGRIVEDNGEHRPRARVSWVVPVP